VSELSKPPWKLKYDAKLHRLRCQGHILNLAAQSFLFVTDKETLTEYHEQSDSTKYNVSLAEIEKWRRQGPLGKLHNIVIYIQASIQREQKFWELSSGSRLIRDNDTRWNSWYSILAVAINLREAIDEYYQDFNAELSIDYADDILSNTDWETLTEIKGFLEKLSYTTKALELPETCIDLTLPNFEYILKVFETVKELNSTNHIVGPILNSG
jgi:hypothetical protein